LKSIDHKLQPIYEKFFSYRVTLAYGISYQVQYCNVTQLGAYDFTVICIAKDLNTLIRTSDGQMS